MIRGPRQPEQRFGFSLLAGTRFARSMRFVYIHIIWFAAWIGFRVEPYPFGLLTMIVSLEAIFLSTFVMISQNRADEKRRVLADTSGKQSSRRSSRTRSCAHLQPDPGAHQGRPHEQDSRSAQQIRLAMRLTQPPTIAAPNR
jgi:hypothetical protein